MTKRSITTLLAGLAAAAAVLNGAAQAICPPRIEWQQTYGSSGTDSAFAIQQTSDGGFIVGGASIFPNPGVGNRTAPQWGLQDFWVVRTDAAGTNLWDRAYGSLGTEHLISLEQTGDGGFILAGQSSSLSPSGNKTAGGYGDGDIWLVRTDADGNKLWDVSFGGIRTDWANSVARTSDGGFVVAGGSSSPISGNKSADSWGGADFWIVRLDGNGQKLWDRSFGGDQWDVANVVRETTDGGFILGGYSGSTATGNKSAGRFGLDDYWVVRLDASGNKLWDRAYGGNWGDELRSLVPMPDGGFLLAGDSYSFPSGSKTNAHFGSYDWWVVRVDEDGEELWQRSYGGTDYDVLREVNKTSDGGFILSGSSLSRTNEIKTGRRFGSADFWMVRTDGTGERLWDLTMGSRGEETMGRAQQTADGGFVIAGTSYDERGNKTSPTFGDGDFWVVKFQAETPGDCDGDGVPDALDLCADTPPGTVVNSNGCAIAQLCPCTNDWRTTREYVRCVKRASGEFVQAGLMTEAEREAIVEEAEATNCPPLLRPGFVVFGLTNAPLGEANLILGGEGSGSYQGPVTVDELGIDGLDGVAVLTGEADSGVFLYPDAPIWGDFSDDWFMLGKAFGRLNGAENSLVSSLLVTKPNYETYPVDIDFTPLAPSSLTFQVFSNGTLVTEATTEGATGRVTVFSATYLGPRGNPFWRMPNGSVGAVVEFTVPVVGSGEYYPNAIAGPFGNAHGDRVFIRADQPANTVDFISRVDVTGFSGQFNTFSFLDERLGVFRRSHKALGPVIMTPARGRLAISGLPGLAEFSGGVLVETDSASRFDVHLAPLALPDPTDALTISGAGSDVDEDVEGENDGSFAQTVIWNASGQLKVSAYFSPAYFAAPTNRAPLRVIMFRHGTVVGSATVSNETTIGDISARAEGEPPEIIASGLITGRSNVAPHFALTFRRQVIFTASDGTSLRGNHVRIGPVAPAAEVPPSVTFSVNTYNVPFTITGEQSAVTPPSMDAVTSNGALELTWPVVNQPFVLETASSLLGPFSTVTNEVEYINDANCLSLPVESAGNRFFRLRLSTD